MRAINKYLTLIFFVGLTMLVAAFGAQFEPGAWYAGLDKPPWTPPDWVFAPVWTVLYIMIGVSGWLAWEHRHIENSLPAFLSYGVQLLLNATWSWLFFGLQNPLLGLFNIILLLCAIGVNIWLFSRLHALAGWLLLPYLLWVLYASTLNAAIVLIN